MIKCGETSLYRQAAHQGNSVTSGAMRIYQKCLRLRRRRWTCADLRLMREELWQFVLAQEHSPDPPRVAAVLLPPWSWIIPLAAALSRCWSPGPTPGSLLRSAQPPRAQPRDVPMSPTWKERSTQTIFLAWSSRSPHSTATYPARECFSLNAKHILSTSASSRSLCHPSLRKPNIFCKPPILLLSAFRGISEIKWKYCTPVYFQACWFFFPKQMHSVF